MEPVGEPIHRSFLPSDFGVQTRQFHFEGHDLQETTISTMYMRRLSRRWRTPPFGGLRRAGSHMPENGARTGGAPAQDGFGPTFAGPPQPLLAARRALERGHAELGRERPSRTKQARARDRGRDGACAHDAGARNGCAQLAGRIVPTPFGQFRLELPDFGPRVVQPRDDGEFPQYDFLLFARCDPPFDTGEPLRRHQSERGQRGAQRMDRHGSAGCAGAAADIATPANSRGSI